MPAGNTYEAIATTTVTGSAVADVTFTGIPSTYTDLVIVCSLKIAATSATNTFIKVGNGSIDTGSNYSWTRMLGDGSSASSSRASSVSDGVIIGDANLNDFTADILHLQNYSNTTTNKTIITRNNLASALTQAAVGMWRSTSAIDQVRIFGNVRNLAVGTTISIYGIKAA
jgi:hypothetical protein